MWLLHYHLTSLYANFWAKRCTCVQNGCQCFVKCLWESLRMIWSTCIIKYVKWFAPKSPMATANIWAMFIMLYGGCNAEWYWSISQSVGGRGELARGRLILSIKKFLSISFNPCVLYFTESKIGKVKRYTWSASSIELFFEGLFQVTWLSQLDVGVKINPPSLHVGRYICMAIVCIHWAQQDKFPALGGYGFIYRLVKTVS